MKRGIVIKLACDREIAGALASGMLNDGNAVIISTVEDEMRRQATAEAIRRVAVHRGRTSEDWQAMISRAELAYGEDVDYPSPLRRLANALEVGWSMLCWAVCRAYRSQDRVLR